MDPTLPPERSRFGVIGRITGLFRRRVVQNALTLSGVQIVMYVLPLATIPYLVRVLGTDGWGTLAFYQAFALLLAQFIEFGFMWSGTRDVAQRRDKPQELGTVLAGVLGGKSILALGSVAIAVLAASQVSALGRSMLLLWLSLLWASGQGFNPIWFYHGMERMRLAGALTVSSRVLATGGVFFVVRSPSDAWKVLALQGIASWTASLIGIAVIYRQVPFHFPRLSHSIGALRSSLTFFVFNSAVSLYTVGNVFILGLFASPRIVAYYAGAEKLVKAMTLLLTSASRALFPRISYLATAARERAAQLVRLEIKILMAGAAVMSGIAVVFAPLIVKIILGAEFEASVPVVRVGAVLPLLIIPSMALGAHWMISLKLERPYVKIVLLAGLLNCSLAFLMAPRYGAIGMMVAVVITEIFVITVVTSWLWHKQMDPFRYSARLRLAEQGA